MEAMTASTGPSISGGPYSYEEYLFLVPDSRIVEWVAGRIIFHEYPTVQHQHVVVFLLSLLSTYVNSVKLGEISKAPLEVKLWPGGPSRQPDILFISREQRRQLTDLRFEGAPALVVEVISPTSVSIDRVEKYLEYEEAGVREYWIIDPRPRQEQADFFVRGEHGRFVAAPVDEQGVYSSMVLPGFRLQLDWLRRPEQTDVERALAWMLADAPSLPEEVRAVYRRMLEVL